MVSKLNITLMKTTNRDRKAIQRNDYPEMQVGFPERNDVTFPNEEMERIHVDLETLKLSRKSGDELTQENLKPNANDE